MPGADHQSTRQLVISQVFASINNGLAEAFTGVEFKSDGAKSRLALDAMHLVKRLSALTGVTPIPATLPTLVKDKPVPRQPGGASMKNLMRRVSSQGKIGDGFEGSEGVAKVEAGASTNELLAPPGASSLGTPLSSLNPSEVPSPRGNSESQTPYTDQGLEAALQRVVSPLNLPRRSSSMAPSPIALNTPSELPPLPPTPSALDAPTDPLEAEERVPSSSATAAEPVPVTAVVESALPPHHPAQPATDAISPVEAADAQDAPVALDLEHEQASSGVLSIDASVSSSSGATEVPSAPATPAPLHPVEAPAADQTGDPSSETSTAAVDVRAIEVETVADTAPAALATDETSTMPTDATAVKEQMPGVKSEISAAPSTDAPLAVATEQEVPVEATFTDKAAAEDSAEQSPTTAAPTNGDDEKGFPALVEPLLDDAQTDSATMQLADDEPTSANGTTDGTPAPEPVASEEPSAANSETEDEVDAGVGEAVAVGGAKKAKKNRKKKKKGAKSGRTSPAAAEPGTEIS